MTVMKWKTTMRILTSKSGIGLVLSNEEIAVIKDLDNIASFDERQRLLVRKLRSRGAIIKVDGKYKPNVNVDTI